VARVAWRQRQDIGPSLRDAHAMTYDPVTQRTLLFGGFGPSVGYLSETWVWSGKFWTQIGRFGPAARGAQWARGEWKKVQEWGRLRANFMR
jgi:hypothetical protein